MVPFYCFTSSCDVNWIFIISLGAPYHEVSGSRGIIHLKLAVTHAGVVQCSSPLCPHLCLWPQTVKDIYFAGVSVAFRWRMPGIEPCDTKNCTHTGIYVIIPTTTNAYLTSSPWRIDQHCCTGWCCQ